MRRLVYPRMFVPKKHNQVYDTMQNLQRQGNRRAARAAGRSPSRVRREATLLVPVGRRGSTSILSRLSSPVLDTRHATPDLTFSEGSSESGGSSTELNTLALPSGDVTPTRGCFTSRSYDEEPLFGPSPFPSSTRGCFTPPSYEEPLFGLSPFPSPTKLVLKEPDSPRFYHGGTLLLDSRPESRASSPDGHHAVEQFLGSLAPPLGNDILNLFVSLGITSSQDLDFLCTFPEEDWDEVEGAAAARGQTITYMERVHIKLGLGARKDDISRTLSPFKATAKIAGPNFENCAVRAFLNGLKKPLGRHRDAFCISAGVQNAQDLDVLAMTKGALDGMRARTQAIKDINIMDWLYIKDGLRERKKRLPP